MKKFLYLRVNAILGIIASSALILLSIYGLFTRLDRELPLYIFILSILLLFALPAVHNYFIIYLYRKHYPAVEIPLLSRILNTVFSILSSIDLVILTLALIIEAPKNDFSANNLPRIWTVICIMIILIITILIQVTGSFRLIKKVRAAAQLQLEDSFV